MTRKICALLACVLALHSLDSAAVSLNDGGYGQVLIFPFFSAAEGNSTLITIANDLATGPSAGVMPSAIKIRLLGGRDGTVLASFNLYLGRRDAWVAAIHERGGETVISTPDGSCLIPAPQDEVLSVLPEAIGSIEVIQMGSVREDVLADQINDNDCSSIEARWSLGPWSTDPSSDLVPPEGSLRGSLNLIHVQKGTSYSVPAVALAEFSDIVQHSDMEATSPNLSTAHDEGTGTLLGTSSTVCTGGECFDDFWEFPIEAVAAVLTAQELHGEFVVDDALAAEAEWILSYPTLRYSDQLPPNQQVSLLLQDREGDGSPLQPCIPEDPFPFACGSSYIFIHSEAIEVVAFGRDLEEFDQDAVSAIAGIPFVVDFPRTNHAAIPPSGTARLGFGGGLANEMGTIYRGAPVIGVALQEYTNSFLPGQTGGLQRANYGSAVPLARALRLTVPVVSQNQ